METPDDLHVLLRHRLLRQPGGFEGLLTLRETSQRINFPIAERPQVGNAQLEICICATGPNPEPNERSDQRLQRR